MPDLTVLRPVEVAARLYGDAVTTLLTVGAANGCPLVSITVDTGVPGSRIAAPGITAHALPAGAHEQASRTLHALDRDRTAQHRDTPAGRCHLGRVVLGDAVIPVRIFVRNAPHRSTW
jgi:hypothetical protein